MYPCTYCYFHCDFCDYRRYPVQECCHIYRTVNGNLLGCTCRFFPCTIPLLPLLEKNNKGCLLDIFCIWVYDYGSESCCRLSFSCIVTIPDQLWCFRNACRINHCPCCQSLHKKNRRSINREYICLL